MADAAIPDERDSLAPDGESGTRTKEQPMADWLQTVAALIGGGAGIKMIESVVGGFSKKEELDDAVAVQLRKELREENVKLKADNERLEAELRQQEQEMQTFIERNESVLRNAQAVADENVKLRAQNAQLMEQNAQLAASNRRLIEQNGQLSAEADTLRTDLRAMQLYMQQLHSRKGR